MERLPPTEFGRTLRKLIRANYPSQAAFASRLALDRSRVTQLIQSEQERPTYPLLRTLLAGFDTSSDQQEMYEAWLQSFAPSPLVAATPEVWDTDESIYCYARQLNEALPPGTILTAYQALNRLWSSLLATDRRPIPTLAVGRTLAELSFDLDRPYIGLEVARHMRQIAQVAGEPAYLARALWLEALAVRLNDRNNATAAVTALNTLASYLEHWNPRTDDHREQRLDLRQAMERDALLVAVGEGKRDPELIERRLPIFRRSLQACELVTCVVSGNEVKSRAEMVLGHFDQAAESLEAGKSVRTDASPLMDIKYLIADLRLRLAAGHRDVWDRYTAALDLADRHGLVHYRIKLQSLQAAVQ